MPATDDPAVTRNPELESILDRAREQARADFAADREPQVLHGDLAAGQFSYDELWMQLLCAKGQN